MALLTCSQGTGVVGGMGWEGAGGVGGRRWRWGSKKEDKRNKTKTFIRKLSSDICMDLRHKQIGCEAESQTKRV